MESSFTVCCSIRKEVYFKERVFLCQFVKEKLLCEKMAFKVNEKENKSGEISNGDDSEKKKLWVELHKIKMWCNAVFITGVK